MRRPSPTLLVWLAAIAAAVSVGFAAIPLPQRFAGVSGLPPPDVAAPPSDSATPASIETILELSPFGRLIRAAVAPEARETALGLSLHGVVIAASPEASTAIISGASTPARVYRVGEEITAAASLDAVFGDHVVLVVDGRQETLSFPSRDAASADGGGSQGGGDARGASSGVDALRALVTGGGEGEPDDEPDAEASPPEAPPEHGDKTDAAPGDIIAAIERVREGIRDNPQTVLDGFGLEATEAGYRVGAEASDTLLRAGMLPGDIVEKVNGQQVGDIETDRHYFDDVTAAGRARIELVRDGQRVVLSFPLR